MHKVQFVNINRRSAIRLELLASFTIYTSITIHVFELDHGCSNRWIYMYTIKVPNANSIFFYFENLILTRIQIVFTKYPSGNPLLASSSIYVVI